MSKEEVAEIMNYCKENWNYYTARLEVLGISGWRLFGSKAAYVRKRISIVDFRRGFRSDAIASLNADLDKLRGELA